MLVIKMSDAVLFTAKNLLLCSFVALCCLVSLQVESIETELRSSAVGHWQNSNKQPSAKVNWQASWIWPQNKQTSTMSLFRKRLTVNAIPEQALLHITASSVYKLYINGRYVNRGPARSAPHHQSFDSIDISPLLQMGENIIAVQVHFQPEVNSYQHKGRAGLLAQLSLTDKAGPSVIITDESWRAIADPRWHKHELKISRFHQEVNDSVNLSKQLNQWQSLAFDHASWPSAQALMRNSGWPAAQKNDRSVALTPPWTQLVPRSINYLTEQSVKATNLIANITIDNYLLSNKGVPERKLNRVPRVSLTSAIAQAALHDSLENKPLVYNAQQPLIISANERHKASLLVFDLGSLKKRFTRI